MQIPHQFEIIGYSSIFIPEFSEFQASLQNLRILRGGSVVNW
jgi:hypothetical protein